jgi:hypothetical protein
LQIALAHVYFNTYINNTGAKAIFKSSIKMAYRLIYTILARSAHRTPLLFSNRILAACLTYFLATVQESKHKMGGSHFEHPKYGL